MPLLRSGVSSVVASIVAAAVLGGFGYSVVGSAGASVHTVAGIGLLHLGDKLPAASNQPDYSTVIVSQDDMRAAATLPGRSLAYFSGTDVPRAWSGGVPYAQASKNGWLLKDASGTPLRNNGYGSYIGEVGNAAYQRAWSGNVSAFLATSGGKGVFIDDVLRDIKPLSGAYPSAYPNQAAWQAAMASFVAHVGASLRAAGYYVLVNADGYTPGDSGSNDGSLTAAWWRQLAPSVNGFMNENYQQLPNGSDTLRSSGTTSWTQYWDGWQRLVRTAQSLGKDFVGVTYGPADDTRAMIYGRASFLQEWNGGSSTFIFNPADNTDPWNAAWTTNIGMPASAKQKVGNGWMRQYTGGIALVNPSGSASQTFQLGGTYTTLSGASVRSVTLAPTSGLILRSTSTAPAGTTTLPPPTITPNATTVLSPSPKHGLRPPKEAVALPAQPSASSAPATSVSTIRLRRMRSAKIYG